MADFAPEVRAIMARENVDQRTEAWYRRRKGLLTASDVATALGMNPYKSRSVLLKEKCCPEERKNTGSAATEHGNKYEDEAIEAYEKRFDKKVLRFGLFVPLSRAIKDEVPSFYLPQVQVLMEILKLERTAFVQYRPESDWAGMEFMATEVARDRGWFAAQLPSMMSFWETWKELAAKDNVRELLVRKRAVAVPPDPSQAAQVLAKRPCCFVSEVAVPEGKVDEVLVAEPAVDEEGVPLLHAFLDEAPVQVP
ncbi:hypothetical protein WJX74_010914 [Apatococcus lobatus]|uniref:YqaJ viral recombinase domain-containing protein n=1 Tax=Apatococcus lobatus TaxID=904363 RepID=A0AAW1R0G1_9CHLO